MANLVLVGGLLTFGNTAVTPDNLSVTSSDNVVTITKLNTVRPDSIRFDINRDTLGGSSYDTPALFIQALAAVIPVSGGGSGDSEVTSDQITDATVVGRNVLTASDAAGARSAIGAGTSNVVVGTGATNAKAGNYQPTAANISDSSAVGRSVLTASDATAARTAIGAGTSNLTVGTTGTTAAAGNHTHAAATTSENGFMSSSDKTKLDGVATGATANDTNANLLNRANHTGTQAFSTISGTATAAQIPNLAASKITALTGYAIGTAGALDAADSLNAALGKLEARLVELETAGG